MTSIEWLIDQMFKQGYFDGNKPLTFTNLDHLQQQAVEMHKEEIKNAWDNRNKDVIKSDGKTSEQYYQETFVSKGSDDKFDVEKEMFELEQQLDIPSNMRWHNRKPKETLYTEEQVREAMDFARGHHRMTDTQFIQSLNQPKKD